MSSKTKIVVLHLKELIYTGIFIVLGVLFIILLIIMFLPDKEKKDNTGKSPSTNTTPSTENDTGTLSTETSYIPGVYTTTLTLNEHTVDVEVIVDSSNINSVRLINLDDAIATMYPLLQTSFDSLSEQICQGQSLDSITYANENKYTSLVLMQAIRSTLDKAISPEPLEE